MDSEHEVVSVNSGIAMYNSSEWILRIAFRESIKLKAYWYRRKYVKVKYMANCWIRGFF
jgi:hypothetical protein